MTVIGFTGHRPKYLGHADLGFIYRSMRSTIRDYLEADPPDSAIVGMAVGWDTAAAQVCCDLGIPFAAAVPFLGYDNRMNDSDREMYQRLLGRAQSIYYVCDPGYSAAKMHIRNKWIVVHSTRICALYNGAPSGTGNCVRFAQGAGKPIDNLWDKWKSLSSEQTS